MKTAIDAFTSKKICDKLVGGGMSGEGLVEGQMENMEVKMGDQNLYMSWVGLWGYATTRQLLLKTTDFEKTPNLFQFWIWSLIHLNIIYSLCKYLQKQPLRCSWKYLFLYRLIIK